MITFLPFPNYALSAHLIDDRLIGPQRIDAMQALRILSGRGGGSYKYHPLINMWRGYEPSLILYYNCVILEWLERGGIDTMDPLLTHDDAKHWGVREEWLDQTIVQPTWLGFERLHASHRAAMKKQSPYWCAKFDWDEPPVLDLFWPSSLPSLGHYLISPDEETWLVTEVNPEYTVVRLEGTSVTQEVPNQLVQTRVWKIAQRG